MLNFILWEASPTIAEIGPVTLRWYGLLFASGFIFGQQIIAYIIKNEGYSESHIERLLIYMLVAVVVGARLGHVLFYQPDYFLSNPAEILMVWKGGLASHGAAFAIILTLILYTRKHKDFSFWWIIDRIVIVVALGGAFIRMGNLMNSEIIGKPTDVNWGFIFAREAYDPFTNNSAEWIQKSVDYIDFQQNGMVKDSNNTTLAGLDMQITFQPGIADSAKIDRFVKEAMPVIMQSYAISEHILLDQSLKYKILSNANNQYKISLATWGIPRHPSQLYESISTFLTFVLLGGLWLAFRKGVPEGSLFALFVTINFGLRFSYEFLKENQVGFEDNIPLNMGAWLSIPLVLFGLGMLIKLFIVDDKRFNRVD